MYCFCQTESRDLQVLVKMSISFKNNPSSQKRSVANSKRSLRAQNPVQLCTQLLEMCRNTWNKGRCPWGHCRALNRLAPTFQECLVYTQRPTPVCRICFNKLKIQHVCQQQYWKADTLNSSAIISDCHNLGVY